MHGPVGLGAQAAEEVRQVLTSSRPFDPHHPSTFKTSGSFAAASFMDFSLTWV